MKKLVVFLFLLLLASFTYAQNSEKSFWLGLNFGNWQVSSDEYKNYIKSVPALEKEDGYLDELSSSGDSELKFNKFLSIIFESPYGTPNVLLRGEISWYMKGEATQSMTYRATHSGTIDRSYELEFFMTIFSTIYKIPIQYKPVNPYAGFGIGLLKYTDKITRSEVQHIGGYFGNFDMSSDYNSDGTSFIFQGILGVCFNLSESFSLFVESTFKKCSIEGAEDGFFLPSAGAGKASLSGLSYTAGFKVGF